MSFVVFEPGLEMSFVGVDGVFRFENNTASIPPVFSLALDRPSPDNPVGGGLLAIGGIPNVAIDGDFVSVPIYPFFMDTYAFYTIPLDGIAVAPPGYIPPAQPLKPRSLQLFL